MKITIYILIYYIIYGKNYLNFETLYFLINTAKEIDFKNLF